MGMTCTLTPIPAGCVADVTADPGLVDSDYGDVSVDLDKSWHGIHFLLTGSDDEGEEPLSLAIMGGKELGGDGARLLSCEEVQAVAAALPMEEVLRARFDPRRMDDLEIYPKIWDEGDEALDYLISYYTPMAELFREAAGRGDSIAVEIS